MEIIKNRIAQRSAAFVGAMVVLATTAGIANATTPTDPLGGAGDGFFDDMKSYFTGSLVPGVLALALVGVALGLLIKGIRKARAAA